MKLQKLKDKIVSNLSELYEKEDLIRFEIEIKNCKDGFELLNVLNQYGFRSLQGGLNILFNILIK